MTQQLLFHRLPEAEAEKKFLQRYFKASVELSAAEDFPIIERQQANFESTPHAEVVFGRNEASCIKWTRYFNSKVAGTY